MALGQDGGKTVVVPLRIGERVFGSADKAVYVGGPPDSTPLETFR